MPKRRIEPDGPRDAPLVVVGRDPGPVEELEGRPFVGPAGSILDAAARRAGLSRSQMLVTNVVPWRPAGDLWENHDEAEVAQGVRELHKLLKESPAHVVVALGEHALLACLGFDPRFDTLEETAKLDTVTNVRGYGFTGYAGKRVLAMVHPAYVARVWHPWWATFCWDWEKAARWLATSPMLKPRGTADHFAETVGDVEGWGREALAGALAGASLMAVDTEIHGDGKLACVAFAVNGTQGFTVPFAPHFRDAIAKLLACPVAKVTQNGQFDATVFEREGLPFANWRHDTMLLWHVVEPILAGKQEQQDEESGRKRKRSSGRTEKSLRFLASLLTDEPFWKRYDFATEEDRWRLCAKDARVTWQVAQQLLARLGLGT